jgi:hypothetical protein
VVATVLEQLVLPGGSLLAQVAEAAHDEPGGDPLVFLGGERGMGRLGDLGAETQQPIWSSQTAL